MRSAYGHKMWVGKAFERVAMALLKYLPDIHLRGFISETMKTSVPPDH
jgi:hypothetical protein